MGVGGGRVSGQHMLGCEEGTSGWDPRAEREIVELLHRLSLKEGRIVICVTHSLAQMELFDSVMVLNAGHLAYHGSPTALSHYFGVERELLLNLEVSRMSHFCAFCFLSYS